jgi:hypothetical protein
MPVNDFAKWKSLMDTDAPAQESAGLRLVHLWRTIDSPGLSIFRDKIFFLMEVQDVEKARKYFVWVSINWATKHVGIHEFEWHFTEEVALPVA